MPQDRQLRRHDTQIDQGARAKLCQPKEEPTHVHGRGAEGRTSRRVRFASTVVLNTPSMHLMATCAAQHAAQCVRGSLTREPEQREPSNHEQTIPLPAPKAFGLPISPAPTLRAWEPSTLPLAPRLPPAGPPPPFPSPQA